VCGRFAQPRSSEDLARIFRARAATALPGEQFNVAPTDEVSAVVERDADRTVDAFRWGLVPHWADGVGGAARRINARVETVERSPAYRAAFRGRRCIIPADAFYEWRRDPAIRRPRPYAVERVDDAVMALAGLWAAWRDPASAARLYTVTILTTIPNAVVAGIHDRMPVILEPDDWDAWLDEATPVDDLRPLLGPAPDDALRMRAVSPAVNDVRNEGPQLLAPWPPEPAPGQPSRPA
jgi:putative SOS response-associated peptidase YedK